MPLMAVQREWRARLHARLYGHDAASDPPAGEGSQRRQLLPGEAYRAYATADPQGTIHPSYKRVLSHAAMCIGLGGGDAEFGGEAWKEMLEVVCEMEQLLLRRMRREAKLSRGEGAVLGREKRGKQREAGGEEEEVVDADDVEMEAEAEAEEDDNVVVEP